MVAVGGLPTQSAIDQVLSTTRNVRKRLDTTREVPRELIEDCLRVAMAFTQPLHSQRTDFAGQHRAGCQGSERDRLDSHGGCPIIALSA